MIKIGSKIDLLLNDNKLNFIIHKSKLINQKSKFIGYVFQFKSKSIFYSIFIIIKILAQNINFKFYKYRNNNFYLKYKN